MAFKLASQIDVPVVQTLALDACRRDLIGEMGGDIAEVIRSLSDVAIDECEAVSSLSAPSNELSGPTAADLEEIDDESSPLLLQSDILKPGTEGTPSVNNSSGKDDGAFLVTARTVFGGPEIGTVETDRKVLRWNELVKDFELIEPGNKEAALGEYLLNKNYSNDSLEVRQSMLGGLGCFALKNLRFKDVILIEQPLLMYPGHYSLFDAYWKLEENVAAKALFHTLQGWSTRASSHPVEAIAKANAFETPRGRVIATVASRFNHACQGKRNVTYGFDVDLDAMVMTVVASEIRPGEELLISYGGSQESLYQRFGFRCDCGSCVSGSEELWDKYGNQASVGEMGEW